MADEAVPSSISVRELEFEQGHISSARSVPVENLKRRLAELPATWRSWPTAAGSYCVYSDEAVRLASPARFQGQTPRRGFPRAGRRLSG